MQGSLQNAWFGKGGKWKQDVQQHGDFFFDFSNKNVLKWIENGLKTTVAERIAKKRLFSRKFLPEARFGMDFDSLWGPKVTPGWTKEVSKRWLFWHLMPAGISPGPQGAPRSHFQNHLRLILEQFWSFWDIFAMVLGLKLRAKRASGSNSGKQQHTIAHSKERQAANGSKQQQTAAKIENCSQEQPTTCVHSWLAWLE